MLQAIIKRNVFDPGKLWILLYKRRDFSGVKSDHYQHHTGMSLPKPAKQQRTLTGYSLAQKVKVLQRLDAGAKVTQLSKELGIAQNTISTWKNPKNRAKIMADYNAG